MQQVAAQLDHLNNQAEIQALLDELEYLFEVVDPELQDLASDLIERLRTKLDQVR